MSQNGRNTRFFWFMLVLLGVSIYVAVMFVNTVDSCGKFGNKHWESLPPRWVCTP
jgi:hypothetical protein